MSSIGIPIFVVGVLLAGTAAAIVITPRDVLRSTVVTPSPYLAETVQRPQPAILPPVPVVQVASMTVEVTPLGDAGAPVTLLPPQQMPDAALPTATATAAAAEPTDLRRITAGGLNMRAEPNKFSDLLATLPRGTVVSVLDTSGSWAQVVAPDGTTGWLSQNFLTSVE